MARALRLREGIDLGFTATHAGFCAELALRGILPSLKDRDELPGQYCSQHSGATTGSKRDEVLAHRQVWDDNLGADVHPGDRSFDVEADLDNPGYFPKRWSCHRVNRNYLQRFMELASANQVQVVWLLPPVVPKFQARRDELGLEAMYTSFLKPWLMDYPNLSVLDARHSGYDASLFIDSLHLSRRGRGEHSAERSLRPWPRSRSAHSTSERWTRLPDLGTERSGAPHERSSGFEHRTSHVKSRTSTMNDVPGNHRRGGYPVDCWGHVFRPDRDDRARPICAATSTSWIMSSVSAGNVYPGRRRESPELRGTRFLLW